MTYRFRKLSYIYNSRVDFIDLWISSISFLIGVVLLLCQPIESIPSYHFLISSGIHSKNLGFFAIFVGLSSIIRILLPFKVNVLISTLMKTFSLGLFVLLSLSVLGNPSLPISIIFYFAVSLLAFDNLVRTK